ncbi:MAG: HisA/HisF-related TIM barrel protein [Thermoanaerobaculales bacterium]
MIAWAAVDVLGGRAVRLRKGRPESATDYGPALEAVSRWASEGLRYLHVVDLGAALGGPESLGTLLPTARKRWPSLCIQAAGGIRDAEAARRVTEQGAARMVLGSLIFSDEEEASKIARELGPQRCVAALDVRGRRVNAKGWTEDAGTTLDDACRKVKALGFAEVLVTDIARDGLLEGPNLELYASLESRGLRVIASGGVACTADLLSLAALPHLSGVVVGRALYEGQITGPQLVEWMP